MKRTISTMLLASSLLTLDANAAGVPAPIADHHQHLFSPGVATMIAAPSAAPVILMAADMIELLDKAGIKRVTVMSTAYMYGSPNRVVEDESTKVHHMAIGVHMRTSTSQKFPYGAEQGRLFLEQLLPQTPDVPMRIAHLGGTGPGFENPPSHAAIAVLTEAAAKGDPRTRNRWFDVASIAHPSNTPQTSALIARLLCQGGIERVLNGSDSALRDNLRPREAWAGVQGAAAD